MSVTKGSADLVMRMSDLRMSAAEARDDAARAAHGIEALLGSAAGARWLSPEARAGFEALALAEGSRVAFFGDVMSALDAVSAAVVEIGGGEAVAEGLRATMAPLLERLPSGEAMERALEDDEVLAKFEDAIASAVTLAGAAVTLSDEPAAAEPEVVA